MTKHAVVIAGGGPTGLMLAAELALARVDVNQELAFLWRRGPVMVLNFHCFTKYIKVAFFPGTSLRPVPPGEAKHKDVCYIDIHEGDALDEAQMATGSDRRPLCLAGSRSARRNPAMTSSRSKGTQR